VGQLDHLVLTTANEAACVDFYCRVLGMTLETFVGGTPPVPRLALRFGRQKINLHVRGREFEPKAQLPTPGSLDLCFMLRGPLSDMMARLEAAKWPVEAGPVLRTGATTLIRSIYVRDPDSNLIELAEPAVRGPERADRLPTTCPRMRVALFEPQVRLQRAAVAGVSAG
jgi:catechol 2,3-dioxygenase-like lactoylglutathione lyase family enzyme